MRDALARTAAVFLIVLVAGLAAFFALRQNVEPDVSQRAELQEPLTPTSVDPPLVARGRDVYAGLSCSRCHAIAGEGNPRSPLDGVGARRTRSDIRAWITASGAAQRQLTRSAVRAKEEFRGLPGAELDALVEYLSSLR